MVTCRKKYGHSKATKEKRFIVLAPNLMLSNEPQWSLLEKSLFISYKEKSFIATAPNLMPSYEPLWSLVEKSFIHWLARKQVLK